MQPAAPAVELATGLRRGSSRDRGEPGVVAEPKGRTGQGSGRREAELPAPYEVSCGVSRSDETVAGNTAAGEQRDGTPVRLQMRARAVHAGGGQSCHPISWNLFCGVGLRPAMPAFVRAYAGTAG